MEGRGRAVGLWIGIGVLFVGLIIYKRKSAGPRGFFSPIPSARITSHYGMRVHPVTGELKLHEGTDFAATTGTPVLAAAAGLVIGVNYNNATAGNYLVVGHADNRMTRYLHLSAFASGMRSGLAVKQGEVIGYAGMTGRVTGPHLHFEVRLADGTSVDPELVLV